MDHGPFSTRKIGAKINVRLTKSADGGFGIKIAERDNMVGANRPTYITAICTTGSAYRDGRLKEGDMLLEVNGIDLTGKSQPEVTKLLKSVAVDQTVEFVVSRPHTATENHDSHHNSNNISSSNSTNNNTTTSQSFVTQEGSSSNDNLNTEHKQAQVDIERDIDLSLIDLGPPDSALADGEPIKNKCDSTSPIPVDGPGVYEYCIVLKDTKSAGLGLYLKFPSPEDRIRGIFIERVMVGGAAWQDGRLRSYDQLLAINGINLMGLSNHAALETLRAAVCRETTNTIRLKIHRRDPSVVASLLHGECTTIESSDLKASSQQPQNTEPASSIQSCDDESIDGEDRFKRDNFARQSVSEKRHAQLMARSSDKSAQKKSNSLESIQTQDHVRETVVIPPRAGTLRVARNRKINESFRAAVDRSYEGSMQSSVRLDLANRDYSTNNERSVDVNNYAYSMGYSTTSTNNDEKVLIRRNDERLSVKNSDGNNNLNNKVNHNNNHISNNHISSNSITNLDNDNHGKSGSNITNADKNYVISKEKKSSLLSKFFGSMKKLKKKNKDDETTKTHAKTVANNRERELNRSQSSKSSHSRFQSSQTHPSSVPPNHQFQPYQQQMTPNGLSNFNQNLKPVQLSNRASLPTHNHHHHQNLAHHVHQPSMTFSKFAYHMIPEQRPLMNGHHYSNSYIQPIAQQFHHPLPVDPRHQQMAYQTSPRMMQTQTLNGSHPYNQWQSPSSQMVGLPVTDGLWVTSSPDDSFRLQPIYGTHTQNITQMHNQRNVTVAQHASPFVPTINGQVPNKMMHHLPGQTATLPHPTHQNNHLSNPPPPRIIYYDF